MPVESNQKLLTLAFPCYRRPELLRGAISSVADDVAGNELEILICDDSHDRLNEPIAEEASRNGLNVRYVHNSTNLGIDANIKQCFDLAQTDYCWTVGEDDRLSPGAVSRALDQLGARPDILITNYVYVSDDYARVLSRPLLSDLTTADRRALLTNFYLLGFIGASIIRTEVWKRYTDQAPVGTYFHHLSVIGEALLVDQLNYKIDNDVSVYNRSEGATSTSWVDQSLAVHFGYYQALDHFDGRLGPGDRNLLHRSSSKLFRPYSGLWLLSKRADGAFDRQRYREFFENGPTGRSFVANAVSRVPQRLALTLKRAYFKVRSRSL